MALNVLWIRQRKYVWSCQKRHIYDFLKCFGGQKICWPPLSGFWVGPWPDCPPPWIRQCSVCSAHCGLGAASLDGTFNVTCGGSTDRPADRHGARGSTRRAKRNVTTCVLAGSPAYCPLAVRRACCRCADSRKPSALHCELCPI